MTDVLNAGQFTVETFLQAAKVAMQAKPPAPDLEAALYLVSQRILLSPSDVRQAFEDVVQER